MDEKEVVQSKQIMNENFYEEIRAAQERGFTMLFDSETEENDEETIEICLKRLTKKGKSDIVKM